MERLAQLSQLDSIKRELIEDQDLQEKRFGQDWVRLAVASFVFYTTLDSVPTVSLFALFDCVRLANKMVNRFRDLDNIYLQWEIIDEQEEMLYRLKRVTLSKEAKDALQVSSLSADKLVPNDLERFWPEYQNPHHNRTKR